MQKSREAEAATQSSDCREEEEEQFYHDIEEL